jgi:hypothetical protein
MARPAYTPGDKRDPFKPSNLNGRVTRITEADRLHPDLPAAEAFDREIRAAFAAYPSGDGMRRILGVCRILRRLCSPARHLTDEHLRELWKTRGEQ